MDLSLMMIGVYVHEKASEVADAKGRASPTSLIGVGVARWLY